MTFDNKAEIDRIYAQLSPKADLLYAFVITYSNYIFEPRDYGTGEKLGMLAVHNLTQIDDCPGITASELAKSWNRTKGAISQNIKVLESKGLIYRKKDENNARSHLLYTTQAGARLALAHKIYDNNDIMQTQAALLKSCTIEEVNAFYKVLQAYFELF
ncbi:MarR family transcriptional regulator [Oscillibacter sp. MSJ-2]|uniref:MarR family transcriptional regulator n=1 Tax=Dysosmobacter acutus TaxID=2841504 RepID=A0ABS6F5A8_9FIRM|nr:MarR family transcriptional regulator [Dysosmobacter acutus]MBU5625478.1 MarR family transcriptional regulator [Dysosmobacter acutus]